MRFFRSRSCFNVPIEEMVILSFGNGFNGLQATTAKLFFLFSSKTLFTTSKMIAVTISKQKCPIDFALNAKHEGQKYATRSDRPAIKALSTNWIWGWAIFDSAKKIVQKEPLLCALITITSALALSVSSPVVIGTLASLRLCLLCLYRCNRVAFNCS